MIWGFRHRVSMNVEAEEHGTILPSADLRHCLSWHASSISAERLRVPTSDSSEYHLYRLLFPYNDDFTPLATAQLFCNQDLTISKCFLWAYHLKWIRRIVRIIGISWYFKHFNVSHGICILRLSRQAHGVKLLPCACWSVTHLGINMLMYSWVTPLPSQRPASVHQLFTNHWAESDLLHEALDELSRVGMHSFIFRVVMELVLNSSLWNIFRELFKTNE